MKNDRYDRMEFRGKFVWDSRIVFENDNFDESTKPSNQSNYLMAKTEKTAISRACLMNYRYVLIVRMKALSGTFTRYLPSNCETYSEHSQAVAQECRSV